MTPTWPSTLPQALLVANYQASPPTTALRTKNLPGVAIMRERTSAGEAPFRGRMVMTKDQVATFDSFYLSTIFGGALPFNWRAVGFLGSWDPLSASAGAFDVTSQGAGSFDVMSDAATLPATVRLTKEPIYRALSQSLFEVELELEQMP